MKTAKTSKTASKPNLRAVLVACRAAAMAKFQDRADRPRIETKDDRRVGATPEGKTFARRVLMTTASERLYRALRSELLTAGVEFEANPSARAIVVRIPAC